MFCPSCGKENSPGIAFCAHCGAAMGGAAGAARPAIPNHLVWAILTTLFCCLPFGIVSIVYAAQVNGKVAAGDVAGAMAASKSAKTWAWVSFGVGLAVMILYFVGVVGAGMLSAMHSS